MYHGGETLKNPGYLELNPQPILVPRTIVVTGIGRSGTTGMMTALLNMGLQNRGRQRQDTLDDWGIGELIDNFPETSEKLQEEIKRRNELEEVWGFKWPQMYLNPNSFTYFQNPRFIVLLRSTFDISLRNGLAVKTGKERSVVQWFDEINEWQRLLYKWIARSSYPMLLVSCEKLHLRPKPIIEKVAEFAGLEPTPAAFLSIKVR